MNEAEALPPIDYSQLATKRDLDGLSVELRADVGQLRGEFARLEGNFAKLEAKVDAGFAQVDARFAQVGGQIAELRGEMHQLNATTVKAMVAGQITTMMLLGGWVAAVT